MSKAPKVLGTLSIVFGSLIAAWSPLSLFMGSLMKGMSAMANALPKQPGMRDPAVDFGAAQAILEAQGGYMKLWTVVILCMSVALIVIGVGMLKRRRWSRKAAIGWSVVGLTILVVQAVAFFAWLQPVMEHARLAYYQAHNVPPPPMDSQAAGAAGAVFGWIVYAVYPIVLLAMLGKRAAADDFTT